MDVKGTEEKLTKLLATLKKTGIMSPWRSYIPGIKIPMMHCARKSKAPALIISRQSASMISDATSDSGRSVWPSS
mgnify:CR=1 FL=1